MNPLRITVVSMLSLCLAAGLCAERLAAADVEVLTRGPIHEAFAQPVVFHWEGSIVVSHRPPNPIAEQPPQDVPQGRHIVWVPGYWSWDDDRNAFIWVSGCWRVPPPKHSWIPGYWLQVEGGCQWIPGFWNPTDVQEIEYLPSPPKDTAEEVPAPPAADLVWVPGCWTWNGSRYAWTAGYYTQARDNWVWVPSHYVCAPRGCVYVPGYWDRVLDRRGVLFAPAYCPPALYQRATFVYSPTIVIDLSALQGDLFCSPSYDHYYFGDYYEARYAREGIYPWYEVQTRRAWYDPIYVHERWRNRGHADWDRGMAREYQRRRDDPKARPARTYRELQTQVSRLPENQRKNLQVVQPFQQALAARNATIKYEKANTQRRQELTQHTKQVQTFQQQRTKWEAPASTGRPPVVTKPPVVIRPPDNKPPVVIRPPDSKPPVVIRPPDSKPPVVIRPPDNKPPVVIRPPDSKPPVVIRPPDSKPPVVIRPPDSKPPVVIKPPDNKPPVVIKPPPNVGPVETKQAKHSVRMVGPSGQIKAQKVKIPQSPVVLSPQETSKEPPPPPPTRSARSDKGRGDTSKGRGDSGKGH